MWIKIGVGTHGSLKIIMKYFVSFRLSFV